MVTTGRQAILENNRCLRNIKSELETLLERGVLTDDAFDKIHALLPAESPLSGAPAPAPRQTHGLPTPAPTAPSSPPVQPLAALSLNAAADAPPPSYAQTTGHAAPPPLPTRKSTQPASKPVLCHARALYKYDATDARDCSLEKSDRVAVYDRMNADWWMGKNLRTGQEGIFPKSYVEEEGGSEKAAAAGYGVQNEPTAGGGAYPPPPGRQNPYDSSAPPMSMANQGYGGGGGGEKKEDSTGKKMGKKFGNAAVFGAGATFGGKIINSIF